MAVAAATTDVPTPPLTDQYQMIIRFSRTSSSMTAGTRSAGEGSAGTRSGRSGGRPGILRTGIGESTLQMFYGITT